MYLTLQYVNITCLVVTFAPKISVFIINNVVLQFEKELSFIEKCK